MKREVDVIEVAVAYEVRPAEQHLFGRSSEHFERAGQTETFHGVAHREGG